MAPDDPTPSPARIRRVRAETWGAWVELGTGAPEALVAVDEALARRLGVDGASLWGTTREERPLEVHLAVTSRCGAGCAGCYMDARPDGALPPLADLVARLRALRDAGVFTVALGGGEPLTRRDLGELAQAGRALGLTMVLTTSGFGMTEARAKELAAFDQVNVSHDGVGGAYEATRGVAGADVADRAMALLRDAGARFGVNLVLSRAAFPHVEASARHAKAAGAVELQLLRYKPAGRVTKLDYLEKRLGPREVRDVPGLLRTIAVDVGLPVRIDCSMVPFLAGHVTSADELAQWGIFGCEAGRRLATVDVHGAVAGCSFQPATGSALGLDAWLDGPEGRASRAYANAPEAPCDACPVRSVCRGGCRVVAAFAGAPLAPDPECPRVRAHRGEVDP